MIVLDSSAVLAAMYAERGQEHVEAALGEAMMSLVNAAEVISRLVRDGWDADQAAADLALAGISFGAPDWQQCVWIGKLQPIGRQYGLSLGDRACLALAIVKGLPVLTADRIWSQLRLGIRIELIR